MDTPEIEQAEILERSADVIRVNGWHQGSIWPGSTSLDGSLTHKEWEPGLPVCLVGAMRVAVSATHPDVCATTALRGLLSVLEPMQNRVGLLLHAWNDDPDRTADEVIELLVSTAKDLRNGESL